MSDEQKKEHRRAQLRAAKQRQREREREEGQHRIEVKVTEAEYRLLMRLRDRQSGDPETFLCRALLTGAKFVANAGNERGGKKRVRRGDG